MPSEILIFVGIALFWLKRQVGIRFPARLRFWAILAVLWALNSIFWTKIAFFQVFNRWWFGKIVNWQFLENWIALFGLKWRVGIRLPARWQFFGNSGCFRAFWTKIPIFQIFHRWWFGKIANWQFLENCQLPICLVAVFWWFCWFHRHKIVIFGQK